MIRKLFGRVEDYCSPKMARLKKELAQLEIERIEMEKRHAKERQELVDARKAWEEYQRQQAQKGVARYARCRTCVIHASLNSAHQFGVCQECTSPKPHTQQVADEEKS